MWRANSSSLTRHQTQAPSTRLVCRECRAGLTWGGGKKRPENWGILLEEGFPDSSVGKESICNAGDLGSIPGLGRIPWRRERLPIPVFWPGEFHGLYCPWGHKESDKTDFHFLSLSKVKSN